MPPLIHTIPPNLPLRREACCNSAIYLTCGERNVCLHSSLRHAINSVQIEKLRDRRSSLEEEATYTTSIMLYYLQE